MLTILHRLDARDRALFLRWSNATTHALRARRGWIALTHLGGATSTILLSTLPLVLDGQLQYAARIALLTLVASHVVVQLIKRSVGRPRPSCKLLAEALVAEPDRFSFPSGHAAAAMSVAFAYAVAFPHAAAVLMVVAGLVGVSRVCLGVHYPGDVLVGQTIALVTGWIVVVAQ